jgi:tetratricopeptide (TPR) repeat protein
MTMVQAEASATTRLKAARLELGWKQARTIRAVVAEAQRQCVPVAEISSLKTMISRWENGHGQPDTDGVYRQLLCAVYGRDEDELGFTESTTAHARPVRVAPVVDAETVDYFGTVFGQHLRADQLMGPYHLVEVVRAQAELLDQILPDARDGVRKQLLKLACQYHEFTGWLYQDAGDSRHALQFSDQAMDYALSIGDPLDVVYLLMRKANIVMDQGSPTRALGLTEAALRQAKKVSPRVRALALGQHARAQALSGESDECAKAIDAALHEVARPYADGDAIAPYCTTEYVAMEAAASWSALGRSEVAIPIFERALEAWPAGQRRDQGLCQTRLAVAYAERGDPDSACEMGQQALVTVRTATSARALRELLQLRDKLALWRRDERVSELHRQIKGLTRAT